MSDSCAICARVELTKRGENPFLIHEFPRTYFVVGDHQVFRGYGLLLLKRHVRELHELPEIEARQVHDELLLATRAIVAAYRPWKMNHLSLGNTDEHVHWHLMPRYESDPLHRRDPFKQSDAFAAARIGPEEARRVAAEIRACLPRVG